MAKLAYWALPPLSCGMNIQSLQHTLREFAADRAWQPFHTPKNLAMALVVEAAELVEIFQWMTPEESTEATQDPQCREHISEEIADVLLYLLQIADQTGIDVEQAVRDKLAKNALKYPRPM
jgi:NTP pyrophosphatase (non-canonical NTP hydrolase)